MRPSTAILILQTLSIVSAARIPRNLKVDDGVSKLDRIPGTDAHILEGSPPPELARVSTSKDHVAVDDHLPHKRQIHNADYSARQTPNSKGDSNSTVTANEIDQDHSPSKDSAHAAHEKRRHQVPTEQRGSIHKPHVHQSAPVHASPRSPWRRSLAHPIRELAARAFNADHDRLWYSSRDVVHTKPPPAVHAKERVAPAPAAPAPVPARPQPGGLEELIKSIAPGVPAHRRAAPAPAAPVPIPKSDAGAVGPILKAVSSEGVPPHKRAAPAPAAPAPVPEPNAGAFDTVLKVVSTEAGVPPQKMPKRSHSSSGHPQPHHDRPYVSGGKLPPHPRSETLKRPGPIDESAAVKPFVRRFLD